MKVQRGFTFIEVLTVLSIIALATIGSLVARDWAVGNSRINEAKSQIVTIQLGTQIWRPSSGLYTGITLESMSGIAAVPENWSDGVGLNPWGGNISVSADSSDPSRYIIAMTGIGQEAEGARVARDFGEHALSAVYDSGTLTLRFQG